MSLLHYIHLVLFRFVPKIFLTTRILSNEFSLHLFSSVPESWLLSHLVYRKKIKQIIFTIPTGMVTGFIDCCLCGNRNYRHVHISPSTLWCNVTEGEPTADTQFGLISEFSISVELIKKLNWQVLVSLYIKNDYTI